MTGKDKVKDIEFKDYLKKLKGLLKPGDMGDEGTTAPVKSWTLTGSTVRCFGQPKNASCF